MVAAERFAREARAAAAITSEHGVRVLDVGALESGVPYMVMEYLAGVDLAEMLRRQGKLDVASAVGFVLDASEAIAEAHALGIVHRDLKPSNIFVAKRADGSPLVKVLDFGISKTSALHASIGQEDSLTESGHVVGSPGYMSPEQIRDGKGADAQSDVWALGVILYELLAGAAPFAGATLGEILAKVVADSPVALETRSPEVPLELGALVMRCLEREPTRRVQSVTELATGLLPFAAPGHAVTVRRIVGIAREAAARAANRAPALKGMLGRDVVRSAPTHAGTADDGLRERETRTGVPVAPSRFPRQ